MKLVLLETISQFKELKKGDLILVKWSEHWIEHHPRGKEIMFYNIYENKDYCDEIICQKKDNHYFNYTMYLEGSSAALEVYKIVD